MAEKVRDGIDGYHFTAGDAQALASLLQRLAGGGHNEPVVRAEAYKEIAESAWAGHEHVYRPLIETITQ
jgi:hypothetical protein